MNHITGRSFLEQVVGSYLGALVQREHIKNKRLDDIVTTSGNYQQANLQSSLERLNQRMSNADATSGFNVGPSPEYGDMPRQLGVTPYPQPPSSVQVSEENFRKDEHTTHRDNERKQEASTKPEQERDLEKEFSSPGKREPRYVEDTFVEPKKIGFPWKETLLGSALLASIAGNGYMMYKSQNQEPPPQQQPTQPSSVGFSPSLNIHEDRGMGSVSIGVE